MVEVEVLQESRCDNGIVTLILNRPARRNALGVALVKSLREEFARLAVDNTARVIIVTGAGDKAFCEQYFLLKLFPLLFLKRFPL